MIPKVSSANCRKWVSNKDMTEKSQDSANPEVGSRGAHGRSPLSSACLQGHLPMVQNLQAAGAQLEQTDDYGHTPLFWAVAGGHLELVQWLVAQGCDFKACNESGESPLFRAASAGYHPNSPAILDFFLSLGADPNVRGPHGQTLLMAASSGGQLAMVQHLLQAGAEVEAQTERGENALIMACRSIKDHAEIVQALLQAGGHLHSRDQWGRDLLSLAIEHGQLNSVRVLINAGLSPNEAAPGYPPPLLQAIYHSHWELAAYLLEQGAYPEARPKDRPEAPTPLMETVSRRQEALTWKLLEQGADLMARTPHGTVLMYALGLQDSWIYERSRPPKISTPLIRSLIQRGADLSDVGTNTPLQLAERQGLKQIVAMLKKRAQRPDGSR